MFIVVTTRPKPTKNLFVKKLKFAPIIQKGVTFLQLELKNSAVIREKSVKLLIGKAPVILSDKIEAAQSNFLNLVEDTPYSLKLLQNGIKLLLLEKRLPIGCKTAVLIDLKCKYQELADILLLHFGTLKIVTSCKEIYQNYVAAKLYECGAAVILEGNLDKLDKSAFYVSPSGILFDKINSYGTVVVSIRPIKFAKSSVIHSFRATTPSEYLEIMPPDINEHLYQAALYSYCGKRGLCELYPTSLSLNNTAFRIDEFEQSTVLT